MRAGRLMHGKTSAVAHAGTDVFRGLPSPFDAMRHHSLVVDSASVPAELVVTAWAADRSRTVESMGRAHREAARWGGKFHPESVGTDVDAERVGGFVALVRAVGPTSENSPPGNALSDSLATT